MHLATSLVAAALGRVAALLVFFSVSPCRAADIHVPADQPTIQDAINVAVAGDRVVVAPGVYTERIRFKGKAITVESSGGPLVTTIDGGGAGSVVRFQSGEGPDSVIEGFTLSGGRGNGSQTSFPVGGGVFCWASSPTIRGNVIVGNRAHRGGGIYCHGPGSPHIVGNRVEQNIAGFNGLSDSAHGGGIFLRETTARVEGNEIREHSLLASGSACGGMSWSGDDLWEGNLFEDQSGFIAGLLIFDGRATIRRNTFRNHADLGVGGMGSALRLDFCTTRVEENRFEGNSSIDGGAVALTRFNSHTLENNLFVENHADAAGGAVWIGDSSAVLTGNTYVGNTADGEGGALAIVGFQSDTVDLRNEIFWDNLAPSGPQISLTGSRLDVDHCDVAGGPAGVPVFGGTLTWGASNLDADPQFVDAVGGDHRLQLGSPCIDAGTTVDVDTGGVDLGGNPRLLDSDLDGSMLPDMGAHEFSHVGLELSGDFSPGGSITLAIPGTPGLRAFLFYGLQESEVVLKPYGTCFLDLSAYWGFRFLGVVPLSPGFTIPALAPAPLSLHLQALGVQTSNGKGTFSNPATLRID